LILKPGGEDAIRYDHGDPLKTRPFMHNKKTYSKTPFVLITFFLILWMVGLDLGEPQRVLEQAKSICLACIGIG